MRSFFARDLGIKTLLLLLAAGLLALQYHTIAKLSIYHPATSHVSLSRFIDSVRAENLFDLSDALLGALILILAFAIVAAELRKKSLSLFLHNVLRSEKSTLLLLGIVALVSLRYYFARGALHWSGDAAQHVVYVDLAARALARFELPTWTFAIGTGSPYLQNYGFLFFYLAGLCTLAVQDLNLGIKLCMAFAHIASGFGMYFFVRRLTHSRRAGLFAGLAYILCFWHVQQVLLMGRLPLALFYALMPFAFWAIEMLAPPAFRLRAVCAGALTLAGLLFTHPGYGAYSALAAAFYAFARAWNWRTASDAKERIYAILATLGGGALLSSYMTVGMWAERVYTNIHSMSFGLQKGAKGIEQVVPDPSWQHLFVWSNYRFWLFYIEEFHWYGGYLGLALVALALFWGAYFLHQRPSRSPYLATILCLFAATWVVLAYRLPPVNMLHFLQNMNAARYLLFVVFFLSATAGIGSHALRIALRRKTSGQRLFTLLLFALFIDLGTTTFIHPYMALDRNPTAYPEELFADVREQALPYEKEPGQLPPYRILWPMNGNNYLNVATTLHLSNVPTADAFHPGELRALDTFTRPFIDQARQIFSHIERVEDLSSQPEIEQLRAGFTLLNARHVMLSLAEQEVVYFLLYRYQSPIVVAPQLIPFSGDIAPLALIDSMVITPARAQSKRILARDIPQTQDRGGQPRVEVLDHRVYDEHVRLQVRVDRPCFARLAYAYFPFLEISLDGQPIPFLQTAGRSIAIELEAGEHVIDIQSKLSPLRRSLLALAAALVLLASALLYRQWRAVATKQTAP